MCWPGPPMRVAIPTDLVSVREASRRSGVPLRTLYHWISNGRLESVVVADRICVTVDDVALLTGKAQ